MPRDGRKGRKRQGLLSSSDVSLRDFADCSCPQACGRLKKSVVGATAEGVIMKASGQKMLEEKEREDLTWFEKDLDDFVIDDTSNEDEDESTTVPDEKASKKELKNRGKQTEEADGFSYPLDLWFHLSNFVDPEDIRNFARICREAYTITRTSSFWRRLYERFFTKKKILPSHLKPSCMERVHGLRSRVICSMFYLHAPFVTKIQSRGPLDDEPHALKGFNDLFFNPENGCCVLQVTCCHFASVAPVMGLLLKQVYMTLSTGFRHHRLRLHFDSSVAAGDSAVSDTVVTLDDIMAIKVLDWWHPQYPFNS